ncbi:unnamed protein product [Moneuplotes crassus]|uniref:PPPDE domain-containing protein n=1 Tax=Euplotes crassus TaxID=5936 RepID=A0AAD1X714_EUPCR|nr:unnamed protein product [Moneuplotes crassus]
MDNSRKGSRRGSFEESLQSPASKRSYYHKSVRSGGEYMNRGLENLNITGSLYNEKVEEAKGSFIDDERSPKLRRKVGEYANSSKDIFGRPFTSNQAKRVASMKRPIRPSTSKPVKQHLLRKGRTKVLSQEEYFELQNSEKKRVNRKSIGVSQVSRPPNCITILDKPTPQEVPHEETKTPDYALEKKASLVQDKTEKVEKPKKHKKNKKEKKSKKSKSRTDRKKKKKHKHKHKPKEKTIQELVEEFNFAAATQDNRERAHFDNGAEGIFLRVYCLNRALDWLGFGLYHCSIQVYSQEYYYGGHDSEITGIVETDIGKSTNLYLKETLLVGYTYYDADDVDLILDEFGKFWQGCLYDPFRHNCNDFARAVIQHLAHEEGCYEFPEYVNRFSKFSSVLRVWFQPLKNLFGDIVNAPDGKDEGEGNGEELKGDIEQGVYYQERKDDEYEEVMTEVKRLTEKYNSFYLTGFYENSKNTAIEVIDLLSRYSNAIDEIKDIRLATLFHLATCYQKLNEIERIIECCTECISIDPYTSKYYVKRGKALANYMSDFSGALQDLNDAYALDPSDPVISEEIKKVCEKLERENEDNNIGNPN